MNSVKKIFDSILRSKVLGGPRTSFLLYWKAYGGREALLRSVYFWASLLLTVLIMVIDLFSKEVFWCWWEDVITIIPSILGFSLGGYAILISFGDAKFLSTMRGKSKNQEFSLYMQVNATFLHFIFVQFLSVLYAVLAKGLHLAGIWVFDFFGVFIFLYSLFTVVSTALAVLNLADWFDTMGGDNSEQDDNDSDDQ